MRNVGFNQDLHRTTIYGTKNYHFQDITTTSSVNI
jgi:hypothetical protein